MPAWKLVNMTGGSVTMEDGLDVPYGGSVTVNAVTPSISEAVEKKLLKAIPPLDDTSGKFNPNTGNVQVVAGASSQFTG